jgi:hypothetical protein
MLGSHHDKVTSRPPHLGAEAGRSEPGDLIVDAAGLVLHLIIDGSDRIRWIARCDDGGHHESASWAEDTGDPTEEVRLVPAIEMVDSQS